MSAPAEARPVGPRQRLLQVLACSALGPGLDGVLLFDLEPEMVAPVTDAFAALLQLREQRPVRRTTLGSVTGDDELWLRPTLRHDGNGVNFSLSPGPLVDNTPDSAMVVVVPDLVRLSLPGMRAAVQLLGADVAAVERSGFRARWRPRARWLAACQEAEIGRLSPTSWTASRSASTRPVYGGPAAAPTGCWTRSTDANPSRGWASCHRPGAPHSRPAPARRAP